MSSLLCDASRRRGGWSVTPVHTLRDQFEVKFLQINIASLYLLYLFYTSRIPFMRGVFFKWAAAVGIWRNINPTENFE